jgi:hypothetical protein
VWLQGAKKSFALCPCVIVVQVPLSKPYKIYAMASVGDNSFIPHTYQTKALACTCASGQILVYHYYPVKCEGTR